MVASQSTTTDTDDVVIDLTDDDAGRLEEVEPGLYRWHCSMCPGRSVGLYDGIAAGWEGLRRHHEAIRPEVHHA